MKVKATGEVIQIYDFNPVEALKIARKLEREGINFYGNLLQKAEDPKVKEALAYLKGQEEDHLRIFEKLLEREDPEAPDEDDEDDVFDWKWSGGEDALDQMLWPIVYDTARLLTSKKRLMTCFDR